MVLVIMPVRCLRHSSMAPMILPMPCSDAPNDAVLPGHFPALHIVNVVLQILADTREFMQR
jgi:hypothetical protein